MKIIITRILAAILLVIPLLVFSQSNDEYLETERRKKVSFPKIPTEFNLTEIRTFFKNADAYYADHFPLRSYLLKISFTLYNYTGDNQNLGNAYRGKNNWIFRSNIFLRNVLLIFDKAKFSEKTYEQLATIYKTYEDEAQKVGSDFFLVIPPDKSNIYPEYLPPIALPTNQRFVSPMINAIKAKGVKVFDPTETLIKSKHLGLLYYRTDSHWNILGAYAAFNGFKEIVKFPSLPPLEFKDGLPHRGDLIDFGGYEDVIVSPGDNFSVHWKTNQNTYIEDGLIVNDNSTTNQTVWVFRDSFTLNLMQFLSATYKKVRVFEHFQYLTALSSNLEKPDVIFFIITESNAISISYLTASDIRRVDFDTSPKQIFDIIVYPAPNIIVD
jgi:hypothetical protein